MGGKLRRAAADEMFFAKHFHPPIDIDTFINRYRYQNFFTFHNIFIRPCQNIFIRLYLAVKKYFHLFRPCRCQKDASCLFSGRTVWKNGAMQTAGSITGDYFRKLVFNCYRSPLFCIISSFIPSYKFPLTKFSFQTKSQDVTIELLKSNIERNIPGMEW